MGKLFWMVMTLVWALYLGLFIGGLVYPDKSMTTILIIITLFTCINSYLDSSKANK